MSDITPTMLPKQMAFFSDWYVEVRWPDGQKERVNGFSSEAHALGWIEHESPAWLAANKKSYRPRSSAASSRPAAAKPTGVGVALADLAEQFEAASVDYAKANDVRRDADWFVLKLQEELGELTQVWMKLSGRGRPRGQSPEALREALANEAADLLGHILLFARAEGIDLDAAIERKWGFAVAKPAPSASVAASQGET